MQEIKVDIANFGTLIKEFEPTSVFKNAKLHSFNALPFANFFQ